MRADARRRCESRGARNGATGELPRVVVVADDGEVRRQRDDAHAIFGGELTARRRLDRSTSGLKKILPPTPSGDAQEVVAGAPGQRAIAGRAQEEAAGRGVGRRRRRRRPRRGWRCCRIRAPSDERQAESHDRQRGEREHAPTLLLLVLELVGALRKRTARVGRARWPGRCSSPCARRSARSWRSRSSPPSLRRSSSSVAGSTRLRSTVGVAAAVGAEAWCRRRLPVAAAAAAGRIAAGAVLPPRRRSDAAAGRRSRRRRRRRRRRSRRPPSVPGCAARCRRCRCDCGRAERRRCRRAASGDSRSPRRRDPRRRRRRARASGGAARRRRCAARAAALRGAACRRSRATGRLCPAARADRRADRRRRARRRAGLSGVASAAACAVRRRASSRRLASGSDGGRARDRSRR